MSTADPIQVLLASFDRLTEPEKLVVAREIGKRISDCTDDVTLEAELNQVAADLFLMLDREEEANGTADSASW